METDEGANLADSFHSLPGGVYPLYHVLDAVGLFSGGSTLPVQLSHLLQAAAVCLRKGGRKMMILANLTSAPIVLRVKGISGEWQPRWLDENTMEDAILSPDHFRTRVSESILAASNEIRLQLLPYATCFFGSGGLR
jgi:hypothetical protein